MENRILFLAGIKKQKGSLTGIGVLLFLVSLTLCSVLTVSIRSGEYIHQELQRTGYGLLTAWVSKVPELEHLAEVIGEQDGIDRVEIQDLLFAEYEANGVESDSEGQMILWTPEENVYRFFSDDLSGYEETPEEIAPGTVYVSPSMCSIMDLKIGDEITFRIARNSETQTMRVAGYYEDPVMGSSMIGMKGFLVSEADYEQAMEQVQSAGADSLAREGAMLHIQVEKNSVATVSQITQMLNENTPLSQYTEFIHSADTMEGFMTILQNAFSGLFAAFAIVLLAVTVVILGHSISGTLEQEKKNMGILKTIGLTGNHLIWLQVSQYITVILTGLVLGIPAGLALSKGISHLTLTTTGILIPTQLPILCCIAIFLGISLALSLFIVWKLRKIRSLTPMGAIRRETASVYIAKKKKRVCFPVMAELLSFSLALRQLFTGKRRYVSACLTAVLLVFFASVAGRMNVWLGPDGKGMMDAFNPADLDLGVQVFGELEQEEVEERIRFYTEITDSYRLAMPNVSVEGSNYTANVITEPERFHISRGRTCIRENEVVLTETTASDLGVNVGDVITIRGDTGNSDYVVSGIYHCANDMGANLGMNREGYLAIGQDQKEIWCYHYFLEDSSQKTVITEDLEVAYGGDIHVHENSWPGLYGILSAMHLLIVFMYLMIGAFVCIVTVMTGSRILSAESRDLGIYKSIGFSTNQLRASFALRFLVTAFIGAVAGTVLAVSLTDPLVASVMRLAGISNFSSRLSAGSTILPGVVIILLFTAFAWMEAGHVKKTDLSILTSEES